MAWPTPQDYNEAIQNPRLNCADPDLTAGLPELTPLGLPRPITGNFASVYRMRSGARDWAIRCFWREYADMPARYDAISRHLHRAALPYIVPFDYQSRGIRVGGAWYPILKMEWVEGALLGEYVEAHLGDARALQRLAAGWLEMVAALEAAGIAHGDLQHGNVLVVGGGLKLVDYDGMYVPALAGRGSHELGHQNYQHPGRGANDFGISMDRFSAWVIYLSLLAVSRRPELWTELGAGDECLLFRRIDFTTPASSTAFQLLDGLDSEFHLLAAALRAALTGPPHRVPPLSAAGDGRAAGHSRRVLGLGALPFGRRPRPSRSTAPTISAAGVSPAWLADHLADTAGRISFRQPGPAVRAAATLGVLGIALLATAVTIGPLLVLASAGFVLLAGPLALVLSSFNHDRAVLAKRAMRRRAREQRRRLRAVDRAIWQADRRKTRNQLRHDARIARMTRRLAALDRREQAERDDLNEMLAEAGRRATALRDGLRERERHDVSQRLDALQADHMRAHLRGRSIWSSDLAGLSRWSRARLWLAGARSAADVDQGRVARIRRMDASVVHCIAAWRVDCELEARRARPATLPAATLSRLALRYGQEIDRIEATQRKTEARAAMVARCAAQRYTARRLPLQTALDREVDAWALRRAAIDEQVAALQTRRREIVAHLARIQREFEPYAGVTFGRYVLAMLPPGRG